MAESKIQKSGSVLDYIKLHAIVLVWGFTGVLGNIITISSLDLVFYRTMIAVAGMFIAAKISKIDLGIARDQLLKLIGVGFLVGLHWSLFFAAVKVGTTSVGMIGLSTTTLWTALMRPFFLKQKISYFEVGLSLIVIAGLLFILNENPDLSTALFLSIGAGFVAAVFSNLNGHLTKEFNHHVIAFYELLGAFFVSAGMIFIMSTWIEPRDNVFVLPIAKDWLYLVILSIFCTVIPYAHSVELLRRLSVFNTNLAVNLEPVYAMILAALILNEHEKLTYSFYVGSAVIVASVLCYPLRSSLLNLLKRFLR